MIPGPREPSNLNPYLVPLVDDLKDSFKVYMYQFLSQGPKLRSGPFFPALFVTFLQRQSCVASII